MRIAFVTEHRLESRQPFSGIPYFMARAVGAQAESLHIITAPPFDLDLIFLSPKRARLQLQRIGAVVSTALRRLHVDCVICQGSSMVPFLETRAFVCLWHDSTWHTLLQMPFEEFRTNYPLLYEWDRLVLENCSLIAYAADWVREETIRHYHVAANRLTVIPFGASVFDPDWPSVERSLASRARSPCQLTFIGVDWVRKRLPVAYAVMQRLNAAGERTVLNVIGCSFDAPAWESRPSSSFAGRPFNSTDLFRLRISTDKYVKKWGFIDKDANFGYRRFCRIMRGTHFLIHPAEFECYGVALAEASAFAVPVLSVNRFGPRSIVEPGLNGCLFEAEEFVERASALILSRMNHYSDYLNGCRVAFGEYEKRLNWASSCRTLLTCIAQAVSCSGAKALSHSQ